MKFATYLGMLFLLNHFGLKTEFVWCLCLGIGFEIISAIYEVIKEQNK